VAAAIEGTGFRHDGSLATLPGAHPIGDGKSHFRVFALVTRAVKTRPDPPTAPRDLQLIRYSP
jgi:hypothetical protein